LHIDAHIIKSGYERLTGCAMAYFHVLLDVARSLVIPAFFDIFKRLYILRIDMPKIYFLTNVLEKC